MQCQRCILNWRKPIYLIFFWLILFYTLPFCLSLHQLFYPSRWSQSIHFPLFISHIFFFLSCMMSHGILIYYFSVFVKKGSHFNSSCHVKALCTIISINMITCIVFMDNVTCNKIYLPLTYDFRSSPSHIYYSGWLSHSDTPINNKIKTLINQTEQSRELEYERGWFRK